MADISHLFCIRTHEMQKLLEEGRPDKAVYQASQDLRQGFHSPIFLTFVADLLEGLWERKRYRRIRQPHYWEIGQRFEELREKPLNGEKRLSREVVFEILAAEFQCSESSVRKAVRQYQDLVRAGEIAAEEEDYG